MNPAAPIDQYAAVQLERLLNGLEQALRNTKGSEGDPIHDLRVSIRRLIQGLRLFRDFLPKAEVKQIRKLLRPMIDLTSEVRNRDIAIELISDSKNTRLKQQIRKDRKAWAERFQQAVRQWKTDRLLIQWRNTLEVNAREPEVSN